MIGAKPLMGLSELLERVDGPKSFLDFVRRLHADRLSEVGKQTDACGRGESGWENHTIEDFLEAAIAWAEDSNMESSSGSGSVVAWKSCATFLYCGKVYE